MKHIKSFKEICEDLTVMSDPIYSSPIMKVRYRQNNDLSMKRASDTIEKPVNDVLDGIQMGDIVSGKDKNGNKYSGTVIRITKDSEGENTHIFIQTDDGSTELMPSTVEFVMNGDRGHRERGRIESVDTGNVDYTMGSYDTFQPTSYE